MNVSDYADVRMAENCCSFVLVDGDHIVCFVYTCNMFCRSADAHGEIELGGNCTSNWPLTGIVFMKYFLSVSFYL